MNKYKYSITSICWLNISRQTVPLTKCETHQAARTYYNCMVGRVGRSLGQLRLKSFSVLRLNLIF